MRLGDPYLALSRIETQLWESSTASYYTAWGAQPRDSAAIVPETSLKQARSKNAIEAAILDRVLDRVLDRDWTLNRRGPLSVYIDAVTAAVLLW